MVLHYLANKYHAFFLYLFFQFFLPKSSSSLLYVYHCSTNKTFTANSAYHFNLDTLLASLSTAAATGNKEFLNTTAGATPDTVYGLFLCRGDVPRQVCRDCVAVGTQKLASEVCQLQKEGIIWQGECLVRYSNRRFFSLVEEEPRLGIFSTANVTENAKSNFTWTLASTLTQVVEEAANCGGAGAKKFAAKRAGLSNVAESKSLYAAAECTWDLSSEHCHRCLRDALRDVQWCCLGKAGGRLRYPSCGLRFELYQFYWDMATANSPLQHTPSHSEFTENEKVSPRTIFIVVILLVVVLAMLSSFCYLLRRKARKKNEKILLRENFGDDSVSLEGLQFDLAIIEEATNNFSHENKIGKGGFGEVYKGILPDGRHIAVKRLSTTSTQGSVEFKNEILLIAKLQHRNLVTLIGFCLEVQEKILIYEYMTNGSLDNLLFDTRQNILSWSERYKIIEGIAQGILYLHEYSRLKVIHRDLKPSNILLDKNMNPKISDFGMARIIELDQDREKTKRIVGTYGYMSPEYAMLGQFSEKSDVFSFGVMVLEIITGKKNINSHESLYITDGLMNYVWRQWKDQKQLSILDPNLKEDYSHNEVIKCIQIGLQCVQENQNIRPTMVTVVSYLDGHTLDFPSPQEPSFFLQDMMDKRIATPKISIHEMSMSTFCPR